VASLCCNETSGYTYQSTQGNIIYERTPEIDYTSLEESGAFMVIFIVENHRT